MKIQLPVKIFRVSGYYYVGIYQSGKYAIVDMTGSPFNSKSAATDAILKTAMHPFEDLGYRAYDKRPGSIKLKKKSKK